MKLTRRHFLLGTVATTALATAGKLFSIYHAKPVIPGKILGASSKIGHKLWKEGFPEPGETIQKDIVIVGGGIAGLAAGYRLKKAGIDNFALLELEQEAGGNSSSGKNEISAYPWGAHYVPLLTDESAVAKRLFKDLGIITGTDNAGLPIYNEYYLCADPHERLYIYGRWQEGLVPAIGITPEEDAQYKNFFSLMEEYKLAKGNDSKKAFAIPVDMSSQDPEWLKLDNLTMEEWMARNGFTSERLKWYVYYCCRDDFGTTFNETSAWAGIHYFAARAGKAANAGTQDVVTWPEGNGWLAHKLKEPLEENIITQALAYRITEAEHGVIVDYWDNKHQKSCRIKAKAVLMATPQFINEHLIQGLATLKAESFSYAPWVVANISLDRLPEGKGTSLSWDNMVYNSSLLGYVVATHQITQMKPLQTVLTYYWPMSHAAPGAARQEALNRSYQDWQDIFLGELLRIHPELESHITHIDIWIWGHAMVRPTKGFIWGEARREALKQRPPIFRAHSDMSGISIFEEAFTRGIQVSERMLDYLHIPHEAYI
jgi:hypothetical protein